MKRLSFFALLLVATMSVFAQKNIQVYNGSNIILQKPTDELEEITFSNQVSSFQSTNGTVNQISVYAIDSVLFSDELVEIDDVDNITSVYITYNGNEVSVVNPLKSAGVDVIAENAHVTVNYLEGDIKDIEYVVSGATSNGSLTINSGKRFTLTLNNATIVNPDSAAIHVTIDKKVTVNLENDNSLVDGSLGEQKAAFQSKGNLVFSGWGTLNVTGNTKHAIYGSDDVTILSGIINVLYAVSDGIHTEELNMYGGTLSVSDFGGDAIECEKDSIGYFEMTGGALSITCENDGVKGIKCDSAIVVKAGTIQMNLSGDGAKGFSSDKSIVFLGGNTNITMSGDALLEASGSGYDPSYATAIKSDGNVYVYGGVHTITCTGIGARGISADAEIVTYGGSLNITTSGSGGSYTTSTGASDTYTAKCINSDSDVSLVKGTIICKSTGNGGKGIKSNGTITFGQKDADNSLLSLSVTTTGSSFSSSNTTNQNNGRPTPPSMGGMGGMDGNSSGSSAKAIKAQGVITIHSGDISVYTATDGAEGIESKAAIVCNGGDLYAKCYDDCMNSSGAITFAGSRVFCWSNGNDAVDSNYGKIGAITINDGVVVAISTKGSPEEGLDCDNNSYIQLQGGYVFSAGGAQGGGFGSSSISNASQGYSFVTNSVSYSSSNYYSLSDNNGNNLYTFKLPTTVSSSLSLISTPEMKSGTTYTIKSGSSMPNSYSSEFNGFYFGGSAAGSSTVTSFSAK